MSTPVKHHFLPQCYLQGFVAAGQKLLWTFNRRYQKFEDRSPKGFGYRHHLYSIEDFDGNLIGDLESSFKCIEDHFPKVRQICENRRILSADDFGVLLAFASTMFARVPGTIEGMTDVTNTHALSILKHLINSPEKAEYFRDRFLESHPQFADFADEFLSGHELLIYIQELDSLPHEKLSNLHQIVNLAEICAEKLYSRRFSIIHAPPCTRFVTSDRPFCFLTSSPGCFPVGRRLSEIDFVLPISSGVLLYMGNENTHGAHVDCPIDQAHQFNLLIARASYEFVAASDLDNLRRIITDASIAESGDKTFKVQSS